MTDYSNARHWAISGLGYGKGFNEDEARENYVKAQLRNLPAKQTIFKTRPKFEAALRTGECRPVTYLAPEGTTGFLNDGSVHWEQPDGTYIDCTEEHVLSNPYWDERTGS